jgi:SAM-dependent methyltransferase
VVRVGAAAASLGALLALIAGIGRTSLAMAREGDLPRWLAAVHPRYRVPHHAEVAIAIIVVALVLTIDLRASQISPRSGNRASSLAIRKRSRRSVRSRASCSSQPSPWRASSAGSSCSSSESAFGSPLAGRGAGEHDVLMDPWQHGDAYERYVGRWSRLVAPEFLSWLDAPPDRRWLDVGCGTGALCEAILDAASPASVRGVDPSGGFLETAARRLGGRAVLSSGSADDIPLADASVDITVSGLVLNFVPDPDSALAEMVRVTASGGSIGAYVWDYAGRMDVMRHFWDAAAALDPKAALLDEGRFPLCHPGALADLFANASRGGSDVTAIDIPTTFADFEDYWQPFLGGQGPAPAYAMSLDEPARARLRDRLRERLPYSSDGSIAMIARAWAVKATLA